VKPINLASVYIIISKEWVCVFPMSPAKLMKRCPCIQAIFMLSIVHEVTIEFSSAVDVRLAFLNRLAAMLAGVGFASP
jgi:hypothetical protein